MKSRRIYIVGTGVIARHHAAAASHLINEEQELEIIVSDVNSAAVLGFLDQFPVARAYSTATDMLMESACASDILVVATPPVSHLELTLMGLESGRHVLVEKPLAMNVEEAREMLSTARANNQLLGCCSSRLLGCGPTAAAKHAVESGRLGQLYHATFVNRRQRSRTGLEYQPGSTWFLNSALSGGGTLMDWSPYDFTVLNHVLSPVSVSVSAAWLSNPETSFMLPPGTVFDTEQHVGAALQYRLVDGQSVNVHYERAACTHGGERECVEIEGTKASISWDWIEWAGEGRFLESSDEEGKVATTTSQPTDLDDLPIHHRPLVYFAAAVAGENSAAVMGSDALFNFACLRAVYDSARTGESVLVKREGF